MGSRHHGKAAAAGGGSGASALTEQCKKYLYISRGLVHVWAVTMHLPAINSTENVRLLYKDTICCMWFERSEKNVL